MNHLCSGKLNHSRIIKLLLGKEKGCLLWLILSEQKWLNLSERYRGIGRIRLQRIPDASSRSLRAFILGTVELGSVIHTDGWEGYSGIRTLGYKHKVTALRGAKAKPNELLPRVHRVASLLKRWILGTHQGAISHEHFGYYLDEFTFRFNRRTSQYRGKLFFRLLQQAIERGPVPYSLLTMQVRSKRESRRGA